MMGRTHVAASLAASFTFLACVDPEAKMGAWDLLYIVVPLAATVIPDIDSEHSFISNCSRITKSISVLVHDLLGGHRGMLHTPFAAGLLALGIFIWHNYLAQDEIWQLLTYYLGGAAVAGYGLHLLLDMFTPMGIKLLYPFSQRYFSLTRNDVHNQRAEARLYSGLFLYNFVMFMTH